MGDHDRLLATADELLCSSICSLSLPFFLREVALVIFTRGGHSVTIVPDGQACVDRYFTESFDVVSMDIKMPS